MHHNSAYQPPASARSLNGGLYNCPKTQAAIESLAASVQAPPMLILKTLLGTAATVIQDLADVEPLHGGRTPTSLYLCSEGGSGVRKTAVAKRVNKAIRDFERSQFKFYKEKKEIYEAKLEIFEERRKNAKDKYRSAVESGEEELIAKAEKQYISINQQKPKAPPRPTIALEDTTTEALQEELFLGFGGLALLSNEGGTVFNGHALRHLPFYNSQWSGEPYNLNRKTSDNQIIEDARLTMSILIQDAAIQKFNKKHGDEAIAIGFWARFLFSCPESNQGFRFVSSDSLQEQNREGEYQFNDRVEELLDELKRRRGNAMANRELIELSDEAREHAINLYNEIEASQQPGGRLEFAKDHGSKLLENIIRVAGVLTYLELGAGAKIPLGILKDAERIGFHCSDDYLRYFEIYPEYLNNALKLKDFFQQTLDNGARYIRSSGLRRSSLAFLRSTYVRDQAVQVLREWGLIEVYKHTKGLVVIDLKPNMIFDPQEWAEFCNTEKLATHYLQTPPVSRSPLPGIISRWT